MTVTSLESEMNTAHGILRSAWSDMYFGNYEWVVEKAYQAARVVLQAYLKSRGFTLSYESPLSMQALDSSSVCNGISGESQDIVWLEGVRELVVNQDLRIILASESLKIAKADALKSIEAAVKIASIRRSCWRSQGTLVSMAMKAYRGLYDYAESIGASMMRVGNKVIIASNTYNDVDPKDRLAREASRLPLGFTPILVTPEEAYALVNLPWFKGYSDVEVLVDDMGIFRLFA